MPNQCNYYQHEGHMIFYYPFIEEFVQQGLVNHVMNHVHNKLSLENHNIKKLCKQTWVVRTMHNLSIIYLIRNKDGEELQRHQL
jgi:hypothetical protein